MLFYMTMNFDKLPGFVAQIKSFDCYTKQVQVYKVPQLTKLYDRRGYDSPQFWVLDQNTLFISGGIDPRRERMNNCFTLNISTNTLVVKENMNKPRYNHGL